MTLLLIKSMSLTRGPLLDMVNLLFIDWINFCHWFNLFKEISIWWRVQCFCVSLQCPMARSETMCHGCPALFNCTTNLPTGTNKATGTWTRECTIAVRRVNTCLYLILLASRSAISCLSIVSPFLSTSPVLPMSPWSFGFLDDRHGKSTKKLYVSGFSFLKSI